MPYIHMKIPYFLKKEINEIYIMHALRSFAISAVTIFIPIFLLEHGYSILNVAMYFGINVSSNILFTLLGIMYASKKGVRHAISLSVPISIIYFISLYKIESLISFMGMTPVLIILPLLYSLAMSFYFMGFHIEFAKFSKEEKSAKQYSLVRGFSTIASVLGPLLGGVIVETFSFNVLFIIVVVFLFLAVTPLFLSNELHQSFNFSFKNLMRHKNKGIPFFAEGFRFMAARYLWPVLLFLLAIPLSSIGGIFTISSFLLAIFTIYMGKKTTDANKHKLLKIGAIGNSISLILRSLLKTFSAIAIVQGIGGFSWALVQLPYFSMFYNNSKKKGIAETIYMREFFLNLGRLTGILMFALLLLIFSPINSLIILIVAAGIVMLFMTKIADEKLTSAD